MAANRLSSDHLYHFKSDPSVIQLILQYGFRHGMWPEKIPYKTSEQHNFIVCFCDIKIEEAAYHRTVYGNNAIVLSKEWGIANGVSPVRYIHQYSPGVSTEYLQSRNRWREIREHTGDHADTTMMDYTLFSLLLDQGKLKHDSLLNDMADLAINAEMGEMETKFEGLLNAAKTTDTDKFLSQCFRTLYNRLGTLHNELERRDAFMRIYQDDFVHPSMPDPIIGKILYDEKEWRSIKFPDAAEKATAAVNKFLPPAYNLSFSNDDVLAILMQDQPTLDYLKSFITTHKTLLDPTLTLPKLHLIDNYTEPTR